MRCTYVFKELTPSHSLARYTQAKIASYIERLDGDPISAKVIFLKNGNLKEVRCQYTGERGFSCFVMSSSEDFYSAVDKMADKLKGVLRKHKEKHLIFKKHRSIN